MMLIGMSFTVEDLVAVAFEKPHGGNAMRFGEVVGRSLCDRRWMAKLSAPNHLHVVETVYS